MHRMLVIGAMLMVLLFACQQRDSPPPDPDSPQPQAEPSSASPHTQPADSTAPPPANEPPSPTTKARYDRPEAVDAETVQLGHAVVMAGFDRSDPDHPRIRVIDPADNLVDGVGRHDWTPTATPYPLHLSDTPMQLELGSTRFVILGAVIVRPASWPDPVAITDASYHIQGMPDLSQHAVPGWDNYCAPAAAANVVYYLSQHVPSLRQGFEIGPGASADAGANQIIGGDGPPPATADSLAGLAGTTPRYGTEVGQLVAALTQYLAAHDDTGQSWQVDFQSAAALPGPAFWEMLCRHAGADSAMILVLGWLPEPRDQAGDTDNSPSAVPTQTPPEDDAAMPEAGAAMPQDGAATSAPEPTSGQPQDQRPLADDLPDQPPSTSQSTTPINEPVALPPAPPAWDQTGRQVLETQLDTALEGILPRRDPPPALPPLSQLPHIQQDDTLRQMLQQLAGSWQQDAGPQDADFLEGGYDHSMMTFHPSGDLHVVRRFGPQEIRLTRALRYDLVAADRLVVQSAAGEHEPLVDSPWTIGADRRNQVTITPATSQLPAELSIELTGTQLTIGGKRYVRVE